MSNDSDAGACVLEVCPVLSYYYAVLRYYHAPKRAPRTCSAAVSWLGVCALRFEQFRSNLFLGTTRLYLSELHDGDHGNLYSKLSGIIVPMGFVFVTAVGWLINRYGLAVAGHVVNILGLTYGILECFPGELSVTLCVSGCALGR